MRLVRFTERLATRSAEIWTALKKYDGLSGFCSQRQLAFIPNVRIERLKENFSSLDILRSMLQEKRN
jgi:hypothetical protein